MVSASMLSTSTGETGESESSSKRNSGDSSIDLTCNLPSRCICWAGREGLGTMIESSRSEQAVLLLLSGPPALLTSPRSTQAGHTFQPSAQQARCDAAMAKEGSDDCAVKTTRQVASARASPPLRHLFA